MKIDTTPKLDFKNVLIKPQRTTITSRSQVDLKREFKFLYSKVKWTGIPILSANMDSIGTFEVLNVFYKKKMLTCLHKFYELNDYIGFFDKHPEKEECLKYTIISTGIGDHDFKRLQEILAVIDINWICIDVANGYMNKLVDFCNKVRTTFPNKIIIAGNVASKEMTQELIINGKVDIVKVGIGPGSACTTRLKTGVGVPQLSAIIDCADGAHGCGGLIIGDGGITCPGDMAKAFGGGADFVMCGGVFSGHDENAGKVEVIDGVKYKLFYGMSSELAMKKHYGKMEKYRSSEGRILKIKYKGKIIDTVLDYLGGLRSTCAYVNAYKLKHLSKCTTFLLVSNQLNNYLV